jgi:hypothetical protein
MLNKILKSAKNYINNKINKRVYIVIKNGYVFGIFSDSDTAKERLDYLAKNDYLNKNLKLKDQIKSYKDIKDTSEDYCDFCLKNRCYVACLNLNQTEIAGIKF